MKKFKDFISRIDWEHITPATWVRYILMLLMVVNTLLTRFGYNPINVSEEELYQTVSDILTVILLIVNTWKNNSITTEAIEADEYKKKITH